MSEYQRIAFRAIDNPVSKKNLEYMRRQSSRAEITSWSFDNEYNFGDFGGDAIEMLRRGYDLHFHYANFGIRKLLIRLPNGLPDPKAAKPYLGKDALQFLQDKRGPGGILSIEPFHEPGDLEELWDFDDLLDRLVPLRAEILDGDLRPLYLAHLAIACDSEHHPEKTKEAPVPVGLKKLSDAQRALAELYELSDSLIAAAAQESPPPAVQRTIAELNAAAEGIQHEANRKAAANATRQRAKRLAAMAADPAPTLRKTEKLVAQRSSDAYRQIATLLAELREALAGSQQAGLAEQQARKLKNENPRLRVLTSELRREGFLRK